MTPQPISGRTAITGVVGAPVRHSLSPLLHSAWIAAAGLDAAYIPLPVPVDDFAAFLAGIRGVLRGVNVTAPFKEQAFALADSRDAAAERCGSANLLLFEGGRVHACSTDGEGLMAALAGGTASPRASDLALILGAGGAARAAAATLIDSGYAVAVAARRPDAALALAAAIGGVTAVAWTHLAPAFAEAGLLINATSAPPAAELDLPWDAVRTSATALDMTYRPLRTRFLTDAEAAGLRTVDGLAMLIGQARPSFQALFGRPPPDLDVRALALAELRAHP